MVDLKKNYVISHGFAESGRYSPSRIMSSPDSGLNRWQITPAAMAVEDAAGLRPPSRY